MHFMVKNVFVDLPMRLTLQLKNAIKLREIQDFLKCTYF